MKKCPKCQSVFTDENSFCLNDGTVLVEEPPPTVAYRPPSEIKPKDEFIVRLPPERKEPARPFSNPQVNQNGGIKKPFVLFAGLLIGAGIVLALVLFVMYQTNNSIFSIPEKTPKVLSEKHKERNNTRKDSEFQGFVNTLNLNLYFDINAEPIDQLPINDRLKIQPRTNTKSPWYNVTCEHGIAGWVHGKYITWFEGVESY